MPNSTLQVLVGASQAQAVEPVQQPAPYLGQLMDTTYRLPLWPIVGGPYNVGTSIVDDNPPAVLVAPRGMALNRTFWMAARVRLTYRRIDPFGRPGTITVDYLQPRGTPGAVPATSTPGLGPLGFYTNIGSDLFTIDAGENVAVFTSTVIDTSISYVRAAQGVLRLVVKGNVGENEVSCTVTITRQLGYGFV